MSEDCEIGLIARHMHSEELKNEQKGKGLKMI